MGSYRSALSPFPGFLWIYCKFSLNCLGSIFPKTKRFYSKVVRAKYGISSSAIINAIFPRICHLPPHSGLSLLFKTYSRGWGKKNYWSKNLGNKFIGSDMTGGGTGREIMKNLKEKWKVTFS